MIIIESLDQIKNSISRIRNYKKGFYTNLFFDPEKFILWIKHELFYISSNEETIIFFKRNNLFFNLYFCSTSLENLNLVISSLKTIYPDNVFVADIIGNEGSLIDTVKIFKSNGFSLYTSLNRMSRLNALEQEFVKNESVKFADKNDAIEIERLLYEYFDEFAEQLPLNEEISFWIDKNEVLVYVENNQIIGFAIFNITGFTSYLRYWFVHPLHRNKKVGASLLRNYFFASKGTKRQLFWVIENNYNAINRYQHYGFNNESLIDNVLININKQYEDKSN